MTEWDTSNQSMRLLKWQMRKCEKQTSGGKACRRQSKQLKIEVLVSNSSSFHWERYCPLSG